MNKVILVIIFNHKFDRNIAVLRRLYKNRFSHIHFLIPFYEGDEEDITPVYENSFYFQGYIAQGLKDYYHHSYDHYLFVADDMILNPAINEHNYAQHFQLQADDNFIPEVFSLHNFSNEDTLMMQHLYTDKKGEVKKYWWRNMMAYYYNRNKEGVEVSKEIPDYQEAEKRILQHGYPIKSLQYNDIFGGIHADASLNYKVRNVGRLILNAGKLTKKFDLTYPLVASYSDILVISKTTIRKFAHYCGVFAATELFVEVAIPTALLLASNKVKTEPDIGKRGLLYWNYTDEQIAKYNTDMQRYNFELQQLIDHFPADKLYIHPIKLSKWKTDLFE